MGIKLGQSQRRRTIESCCKSLRQFVDGEVNLI